jgi:hypothetical protein
MLGTCQLLTRSRNVNVMVERVSSLARRGRLQPPSIIKTTVENRTARIGQFARYKQFAPS